MNKNVENYKKAVDQIKVEQQLKNKVLSEIEKNNKPKRSINYLKYAVGVAAVAIVAVVGVNFANKPKEEILQADKNIVRENDDELLAKADIKRFESVSDLRKALEASGGSSRGYYNGALDELEIAESFDTSATKTSGASQNEGADYSRTNNQVESVDEADIVKTDGQYIYYCKNGKVYIVDQDLNLKATITNDNFSPSQIFVNGDKLVVFGITYGNTPIVYNIVDEDIDSDADSISNSAMKEDVCLYEREKTKARVYDIKDIEDPKMVREVSIDGYYQDARMIENNIYFISNYNFYFYKNLDELKDIEILPCYEDSAVSEKAVVIEANDIAYFENTGNYGYTIIAGFNLNDEKEVNIETLFGAGTEIYVSEKNMYIITPNYNNYWEVNDSTIYKFRLDNSSVKAVASGKVNGTINDQFSIDEYEGNLRIATTSYKSYYSGLWRDEYEERYSTHLTVLDENLEKIGEIEDIVKNERIYAVRFIGNVGYVVTFEQIDPLWVIDLSDPTNPVVKGSLEIPGYSSYLHPYDETHIIGIGYNVEDNGYGGYYNDNIKMSMFDVSDLENPKEIFKIDIGDSYSGSSIMYEHKALFFDKSKDLIGFPINSFYDGEYEEGMALYKIDLENNCFEKQELDSKKVRSTYNYAERSIYIGDYMYVLYQHRIVKYDLNSFKEINTLKLEEDRGYYYYW